MRPAISSTLSMTRIAASSLIALAVLTACGKKDQAAAPGAGGKMPAPEVAVVTTALQPVELRAELPARIEAVRVSQVRARVNGVVLKRLFEEGSVVKEGQSLFQIDPEPYQAQLSSARAALGKAEANLAQASAQAKRYEPLVAANAVSKQEYVNAVAAAKQAEADVASANAALKIAQINYGYANVYAPISGRIGRALVTEGALVSANEATQLATIQQLDKVYLNINQSAGEVQRLRATRSGKLRSDVEVGILLDDGTELPHKGRMLFTDVTVDPATGQLTLRAVVPNPDGALLPGQYVRAVVPQTEVQGILVPQQAVTRGGPQGDTVLVVGPDNKPTPRTVKIGSGYGQNWVVLDGLKPGERVVAEGFQKLQMLPPGTAVKPVPWSAPATKAAPAAAAPATAGR